MSCAGSGYTFSLPDADEAQATADFVEKIGKIMYLDLRENNYALIYTVEHAGIEGDEFLYGGTITDEIPVPGSTIRHFNETFSGFATWKLRYSTKFDGVEIPDVTIDEFGGLHTHPCGYNVVSGSITGGALDPEFSFSGDQGEGSITNIFVGGFPGARQHDPTDLHGTAFRGATVGSGTKAKSMWLLKVRLVEKLNVEFPVFSTNPNIRFSRTFVDRITSNPLQPFDEATWSMYNPIMYLKNGDLTDYYSDPDSNGNSFYGPEWIGVV